MNQHFLIYRSFGRSIKVELDLSSYAAKTDLKNVAHVGVSSFSFKTNLANLKTEVDKLYIATLAPVPNDLATLSNVVTNVVKKTVYAKLVIKIDNNDTTGSALKIKYDTDKSEPERKINDAEEKIPNTNGLLKKTDYNSKITEIENKIPDVSNLVKKANYNTKITKIENKYITTVEYNKFTKDIIDNNTKSKNLVTKTDYGTKLQDIHNRITSSKFKYLLVKNKLKKLRKLIQAILEVEIVLKKMVFKTT